ncbi:hypothetical protein [Tropicimonas sp. IMCC6043]|uniref:hypothetical protein n=1 Tax=Tropicimonas sp. IMCC6043 TaxID=2510645 RepID=UPI00101DDAE4|nr:hypothetical protein [Tropicimonas sp. IMCC6043]RYH08342.1 hypothetical protein EU800_17050 [Tropicimonas sp. IMCC6043]
MIRQTRRLFAAACLATLAACADQTPVSQQPVEPLGEFQLVHNIVTVNNIQKVEPSRNIDPEDWDNAVTEAIQARLGRYQGSQLYHLGVNILGYSVAVPGIPLVLAPKSVVVVEATVWDNHAGGKINQKPKQFTVFESVSPDLFIGSGLTKTKDEQVANLAANIALQIEDWLRENEEWFAKRPDTEVPTE